MENRPQSTFGAMGLVATFLAVIALFTGVAMTCKYLLASYIRRDDLRTAASFFVAAAVTLAILYAARRLIKYN